MSLTVPPEAERRAGEAGIRPDTQALIAEARARARRRRFKMAAALGVAVVMAAAGLLIARAVTGTSAATRARPHTGPALAVTGIVTGHLAACYGVRLANQPPPVTPGTVVVLRGRITWKQVGPGTWQIVYPKGPVVSEEHISNNYTQTFRFALPPGHYVLAGRYDEGTGFYTSGEVTVTAGKLIREDLVNVCK